MRAKKVIGRCLIVLAGIVAVIAGVMVAQFYYRSNPKSVKQYETDNPFITGTTTVSAHRSGAGDFPEETLAAFQGCVENPDFEVSFFEFDLHMTADNILVLLHDDTLDRISDAEEVFGEDDVQVGEKTLAELKQLNMAAQFVNNEGEMPYADLHGDAVPENLRILSLDEVLDYLTSVGNYNFIIEIKDGEEVGKAAADQLCTTLQERNLLDRVIIGSFKNEVASYITANYPDAHRSACPDEVTKFYFSAMLGKKDFSCSYDVLQLPFDNAKMSHGFNLGTAKLINYAHAHNLAMQYWTVNDEKDIKYLIDIGADSLMSDYPDRVGKILSD